MSRISRFSPNWSNPDMLGAITVARETLIADAIESARESALTKNKHHRLFIGPCGSGKTHLITLVRHRLVQMNDLNDTLRIAWLNEDETSDTLLSLLLRVYRSLSKEYPAEFPTVLAEAVFDLEDAQEATRAITELLLKQLGEKTVLLLIENLDTLFHTFGEAGQKSLRALIQNHQQFCTIATAQRLFRGVSSRDAPFFGFFQVEHLKPFSVSEARELFTKIADLREDEELRQFIGSFHGRARIRALHHLTGGNQRLFIILSEFINRKSLDSLVEPFEELVDEQLTPYYQERLRWLSPLQRRIVEYLCTIAKPEPVKAIARRLFSTSQTISKQLQELRKLGYVISRQRGRESLYELAEPLMRLSYQVKETRGRGPLRLLVDFLRVWYDQQELLERIKLVGEEASLTRNYLSAAVMLYEVEGNPRVHYFRKEADGIDLENYSDEQVDALHVLMEDSGDPVDSIRHGLVQMDKRNHKEAIDAYTRVIELSGIRSDVRALAYLLRANGYNSIGNIKAASSDYRAVLDLKDAGNNIIAYTYFILAEVFMRREDWTGVSHHLNKSFAMSEERNQECFSIFAFNYIHAIINSGHSRNAQEQSVLWLVDAFAEHFATKILGSGLILSIPSLQSSNLSAEALSEWYSLWEEQAYKHPELELPVRLLRTAVDFFIAGEDASVLLNLPQEERRVLAKVLSLGAEKPE